MQLRQNTAVMNESADGGGSFVRRMSALARKGRSRRRDSGAAVAPAPSPKDEATSAAKALGTGSTPPAAATFVNEGLDRWNAQHKEWCSGRAVSRAQGTARRRRGGGSIVSFSESSPAVSGSAEALDSGFDSDELYNELLSPQYTPFPKRVKLSKLVEVLVDVWESDGT